MTNHFSECFAYKNMLDIKFVIDKIDCIETSHLLNMTHAFCVFLHSFKKFFAFIKESDRKILGHDLQCLIDALQEPDALILNKMLHLFLFLLEIYLTIELLFNS